VLANNEILASWVPMADFTPGKLAKGVVVAVVLDEAGRAVAIDTIVASEFDETPATPANDLVHEVA
jgi:hypothetical protein